LLSKLSRHRVILRGFFGYQETKSALSRSVWLETVSGDYFPGGGMYPISTDDQIALDCLAVLKNDSGVCGIYINYSACLV